MVELVKVKKMWTLDFARKPSPCGLNPLKFFLEVPKFMLKKHDRGLASVQGLYYLNLIMHAELIPFLHMGLMTTWGLCVVNSI